MIVLLYYSCHSEREEIKELVYDLEDTVQPILNYGVHASSDEYIKMLLDSFPKMIKPMRLNNNLCSIRNYEGRGIAYTFQCESSTHGKSLLDTRDVCHLIKITAEGLGEDLLSYEQFMEYAREPVSLGNNWYYIEQNIAYD